MSLQIEDAAPAVAPDETPAYASSAAVEAQRSQPAAPRAARDDRPNLDSFDQFEEEASQSDRPAPAPRKRINLRRLILPVGGVILVVAAVVGFNMYRDGQMYVSTDNAQLTGSPVQVGSMNAGRVQSIAPSVGATVHKGDPLAVVELPSQVGTAQNGQPKLDFLNSGDSTVTVQSPLDGVVLSVPATPGATVQAGQPLVMIVDPSQLWVNANIEETNVGRLKVGDPVSVHVDALGTDIAGRVESITPATAGTFSILPTSNTSGNFTKITQLVPVRIALNLGNQPALLGSSVEVKIKVA
jgi:multidrug resistance efflux pump